MKVKLDKDRCSGHALCNLTAPDVYDVDDHGYCLLAGDTEQEVPMRLEDQAREGVTVCPEEALSLTDS